MSSHDAAAAPRPEKLTELRLTRMIADWLIAWADDKTDEERRGGASRYPIPAWADSERLAAAVFDTIRTQGVNTKSRPS